MLDWWAARMMAWIGDLQADGIEIVDTFPSKQYPSYDHLVQMSTHLKLGQRIPQTKYPTAYADGTPQGMYNGWEAA